MSGPADHHRRWRRPRWHRPAPNDGPADTAATGTDELGRALGVPGRDPLAGSRAADAPEIDVICAGTVFYDLVFTGLDGPPQPGRERWTAGMGCSPGGVANLAVGLRRLGLRTSLAACFGPDQYGDYCWDTLCAQEDVDLRLSRRCPGWHSPVTVSLAYDQDRALVTHGHEPPACADQLLVDPPPARAAVVSLGTEPQQWARTAAGAGTLVLADVGWDPSGMWSEAVLDQLDGCHAFLPNEAEALHYTRTDDPRAALSSLAERVAVAVVTLGGNGAMAVDQRTGEFAQVPGVAVEALDPTGAGDVFLAGFTTGTLAGWPLVHRLRFAGLTAALAVRHFGGSLSAPGWADVESWWRWVTTAAGTDPSATRLAADFAFLPEVIPPPGPDERALRRASVTIGFPDP